MCERDARRAAGLHPRGVRRHGRRRLRLLPGLRGDGPHRHRAGHRGLRHVPRQRPDPRRRHRGAEAAWLGRIAEEGIVFAYGATEPDAGSDLGALKTTASPVETDGEVTGYRINGRKQWICNGSIADVYTILALAPGGPSWFIVQKGTPGFSAGAAGGQARHPAVQHRRAVPRRRRGPGRPPHRRRRGPGPGAGAAGLRLHPRDGRGVRSRRRLGGARPRDRLLAQREQGGAPAEREAGLHAQADRPACGAPGGGPRLHRGDRRPASTPVRAPTVR